MNQLVIRRTQQRIAGVWAETRLINHALRVFNPHADGKGLGLHRDAARMQHGKAIARAMAEGEDHMIRLNHFAIGQNQTTQVALPISFGLNQYIIHPRAEAVFTAQGFDFGADMFHHGNQPKCADMRFGDVQNLLRRAGFDEFSEHLAPVMARIADLAIELAVGKSARPAFAILHIAFGVQHATPPKPPSILGAFAHHLAAFQD